MQHPRPKDSRIGIAIGAALGTAAIAATIAGIVAMQRADTRRDAAVPTQPATAQSTTQDSTRPAELEALRAEVALARMARQREDQVKAAREAKKNTRCINGELIEKSGNTYRNAGSCQ